MPNHNFKGKIIEVSGGVKLQYPVKFTGAQGLSGEIDFGLMIKIEENRSVQISKAKRGHISNFECQNNCANLQQYLEMEFFDEMIMEPGAYGYDLPTSARMLKGFLDYVNEFASNPIDTSYI